MSTDPKLVLYVKIEIDTSSVNRDTQLDQIIVLILLSSDKNVQDE